MRLYSPGSGSRRAGFSLLEMVAIFSLFAICMAMGGTLIVAALKTEQSGDAAGNRINRRHELSRRFRDDVARAEAVPDRLGERTAGPGLLILRMPGGSAVIYHWDGKGLERIDRTGDKESRQSIPVGPEGTTVEFVLPKGKPSVVSLRITEAATKGPAKKSELSAALGGNLR